MDQSKACSQQKGERKNIFQKTRNAEWIKSTLDDGKHRSKCKWFKLIIFTKFMLASIVLSSITKKGEIVRYMAPFRPLFVILVIE